MPTSEQSGRLVPLGIVPGVFFVDRVTKLAIESNVSVWDSYEVIPNFFSIVHTQNRGAAFGLFSESTSEWRGLILIGLSLAVMLFVAGMLWQSLKARSGDSRLLQIGLALVLGGALGNLYDRVATGSVTDFLLLYVGTFQWPAFNVADSAISTGAGLLVLDMWKYRRPAMQSPPRG